MLAAVVTRPGELVIEQVERPKPGPGQFLIKVLASSICNATDNHILEGIFDGNHDRYPQVLGHEVCGEVVELRYHGCADWGKNCHVYALWCISGVCSCGQIRIWFCKSAG